MNCFSRLRDRNLLIEELRQEVERELAKLGFVVVEAQDLGRAIVFKIRKVVT